MSSAVKSSKQQSQQQRTTEVSGSSSKKKKSTTTAATADTPSQQDLHPYARGAVIEVWHIAATTDDADRNRKDGNDDEDWWTDPSSDEEENTNNKDNNNDNNATTTTLNRTVRLCDIIDRVAASGENKWRYYVHYRDFNRRMDEWINMDRIVSPPSIGNAKARALKREEAKRKLLQEQEQQRQLLLAQQQDTTRATRRQKSVTGDAIDELQGSGGGNRRTRLSRKRSVVANEDDATVIANNAGNAMDEETDQQSSQADLVLTEATTPKSSKANTNEKRDIKKEILSLPSDAVLTHTVGEHVVATVKAQELDEHEGLDEASLREHEEVTKVKNVAFLELGQYQMETWYFSPLPKELLNQGGLLDVLYCCEYTLDMFPRKRELLRHQARLDPKKRHPPGNEIYRCGNLSMFEVDGQEEKIYCQNLCYIAKLFLDHKTLYFDVDPFLFYVLCEWDDRGYHPVGYYSKEKYSDVGYNLACILTFPAHQRKGYGRFLIAFSYELTKKEEKVGSPEKPMSDLGQQAYKPYWASTIVDFLLNQSTESSLSIMDISKKTSIMAEDIVFTLNQLGILKIINGVYFIAAEESLLKRLAEKYPIKEPRVDPTKLHWTPYLTDVKRDKFSIHSKKQSLEVEDARGNGGF